MNSQSTRSLAFIYESWKQEDRQLDKCLDTIRNWMQQVNQLGIPHFGETATRLRPLKARLFAHFGRENELILQLVNFYQSSSPDVVALQTEMLTAHDQLLTRLGDLIDRLSLPEPPFESWTNAMDEVALFVDALEQHEEQETRSIAMLMPTATDDD